MQTILIYGIRNRIRNNFCDIYLIVCLSVTDYTAKQAPDVVYVEHLPES